MVNSWKIFALGVVAGMVDIASAGAAAQTPQPVVTAAPPNPFVRRDDIGKLINADGISTCAFISGMINSPITCDMTAKCVFTSANLACWSGNSAPIMTGCVASSDIKGANSDSKLVSCTDKVKNQCVTYNLAQLFTSWGCDTQASSVILASRANPRATANDSPSSSPTAGATSTSSPSSAPAAGAPGAGGLSTGALAGIIVGSVVGGLAVIAVVYFIVSKTILRHDDHGDNVPLIESKQMTARWDNPAQAQGPYHGRGLE